MKVLVSENNLTDIANAIRTKSSVDTKYKPSEMSTAIKNNLMRIPNNGTLETKAAMKDIMGGNFVMHISEAITHSVNKISDISPYIIRSVKLSSDKVLVAWCTKDDEKNKITAVICTITENNSVIAADPITLTSSNVVGFDVIALTEDTVIVGAIEEDIDTGMWIKILNIEGATIKNPYSKAFNELQGKKIIKLAKINHEKFVAVTSGVDRMDGMCITIANNNVEKYGNTLNESGSYAGSDSNRNSIDVLAVNENKYVIVRSNPDSKSNGITVFKCTVNETGITKDTEATISGEYGCSQVSATLMKNDKIFIVCGATMGNPKIYGITCTIDPNIVVGIMTELDSASYHSVNVITVYNNFVVVSFGGYVAVHPGKTKVVMYSVSEENNTVTKLFEKEYADLYGTTAIEQLDVDKMCISAGIPGTEQETPHVGTSIFYFTNGIAQLTHGTVYGVAVDSAKAGETIKVCIPNGDM